MNQRLTKKCFLTLPTGTHLVSNTHHSIGVPIFAETVVPSLARERQWRRIVAARVNGRHFFMFGSPDGYKQMLARMGYGKEKFTANN
jgi:hypothetical protein